MAYARLVFDAALESGFTPVLLTTDAVTKSVEYRIHFEGARPELHICKPHASKGSSPIQSAFAKLLTFNVATRTSGCDAIYVPYGDGLAQVKAISRLTPSFSSRSDPVVDTLVMRGSIAYPRAGFRSSMAAWASFAAMRLAPWRSFQVIDPLFYSKLASLPTPLRSKFNLIPDPVLDLTPHPKNDARDHLGIARSARVLGCVGGIDERKGIHVLLRAFSAANLSSTDILLLAGPTSKRVHEELKQLSPTRRKQVITIDEYLATCAMDRALCAMDLVCLPYVQHVGSASIAIRAAAHQRPVLGTNSGWLGYMIPTMNLGWTFQPGKVSLLATALQSALEQSPGFHCSDRALRFVKYSTAENFKAHLSQIWARPPSAAREVLSWDWVFRS